MTLVRGSGLAIPERLTPVGLELTAGSLTCLIGPNGSGKTSLLHALGAIGEAGGRVEVGGIDIRSLPNALRPRAIAYLPATRDVRWPLLARDLIALGGADAEEVEAVVAQLELAPFAERPLDRLSTGERSRVLIARALATRPTLLLLDEPTANLDPLWQIKLMQLVRSEVAGTRRAAVVAMHDLSSAGRYADRLIVMSGGSVAADGAPHEVLGGQVIREVFGIVGSDKGWVAAP